MIARYRTKKGRIKGDYNKSKYFWLFFIKLVYTSVCWSRFSVFLIKFSNLIVFFSSKSSINSSSVTYNSQAIDIHYFLIYNYPIGTVFVFGKGKNFWCLDFTFKIFFKANKNIYTQNRRIDYSWWQKNTRR